MPFNGILGYSPESIYDIRSLPKENVAAPRIEFEGALYRVMTRGNRRAIVPVPCKAVAGARHRVRRLDTA